MDADKTQKRANKIEQAFKEGNLSYYDSLSGYKLIVHIKGLLNDYAQAKDKDDKLNYIAYAECLLDVLSSKICEQGIIELNKDTETRKLKDKISELETKSKTEDTIRNLNKNSKQMLQQFFNTKDKLSLRNFTYLQHSVYIEIADIGYHLENLCNHGYIKVARPGICLSVSDNAATYSITEKGIAYIIENNLDQDRSKPP